MLLEFEDVFLILREINLKKCHGCFELNLIVDSCGIQESGHFGPLCSGSLRPTSDLQNLMVHFTAKMEPSLLFWRGVYHMTLTLNLSFRDLYYLHYIIWYYYKKILVLFDHHHVQRVFKHSSKSLISLYSPSLLLAPCWRYLVTEVLTKMYPVIRCTL